MENMTNEIMENVAEQVTETVATNDGGVIPYDTALKVFEGASFKGCMKAAGAVTGIGAAAYGIYRGIKFLRKRRAEKKAKAEAEAKAEEAKTEE